MRPSIVHPALMAGLILALASTLSAQNPLNRLPPSPRRLRIHFKTKSQSGKRAPFQRLSCSRYCLHSGRFALPGAELRIRRSAEKKFRWQTVSNSRGDFAVRVKMGADYEVIVRAKGFAEQSLPVDAKPVIVTRIWSSAWSIRETKIMTGRKKNLYRRFHRVFLCAVVGRSGQEA